MNEMDLTALISQQTPLVAILLVAVMQLWKRVQELEKERKEDAVENMKAFDTALRAVTQISDMQKAFHSEELANWDIVKKDIERISQQLSSLTK